MSALLIWRFSDGKPGHDAQSQGLVDALNKHYPLDCRVITVADRRELIAGCLPLNQGNAGPDLLIGAGRRTHLPMLAARLRYGGRCIVLMKPDLPRLLFDLCIIPEHDGVAPGRRVLTTVGALNTIERSGQQDARYGLILIGGPSRHHGWSDPMLVEQLRQICVNSPDCHWTLTTSRRTPAGFIDQLRAAELPDLRLIPFEDTRPGWLRGQLSHAAQVWVSEDSVSMIYEALTAGAAVGLLRVPVLRRSRIVRAVERLIAGHWVTAFGDWRHGESLPVLKPPLAEAERCARWIGRHWLDDRQPRRDNTA